MHANHTHSVEMFKNIRIHTQIFSKHTFCINILFNRNHDSSATQAVDIDFGIIK